MKMTLGATALAFSAKPLHALTVPLRNKQADVSTLSKLRKISQSKPNTMKWMSSLSMSSSSSSSSLSDNSNNNVQLSSRLDGLSKPTVWEEFTPLSNKYQSINLGQGFPDWDPPDFAVEAMKKSVDNPSYQRNANQYARSAAHLPLANVLAEYYTQTLGVEINPLTNVATAVGCTNALFCALQGLLDQGDEVILMEPAFDIVRFYLNVFFLFCQSYVGILLYLIFHNLFLKNICLVRSSSEICWRNSKICPSSNKPQSK